MTTIYKTTERMGRRAICILPCNADKALATIKRMAQLMSYSYRTIKGEVHMTFKNGEKAASYSVKENNSYICGEPNV